ncbi:tRNA (adenosine(37)-N6)-threonylcarbamoyltransferase complex ATPase subunit type 1 TsaE [Chelativorans sp. ZYF759]|uniref:tRNA (adenosine(37)-N6)-threonylcarbamoyltransferase complex ATPase subunit type 1 TsaE n=1 Tax=Chelativorans sp. ZYF759 TaxID=2692213 RepID=UPI00145EF393|nr:tRNA (adenosine(37)-N6)-threonylcarbamoyltransferase complex ATPase subunit type 1 TsaE [Chelativorans sp. ZYF759]NMG37924.1 tRNA (adenosine(37)-N6)-threonylcarbamoyltransferase complex ATPase subunit type 1 TsaE [Chelativorans sp. ZYF759]
MDEVVPIRLHGADEKATVLLGEDLAAMLRPGDLVFLEGDLGAGKSTLARAIIRNLADDEGHEVPSPTFTIVQPYETRHPLLHVDLYRIAAPEEIDELGIGEALSSSIVLVEWAERADGALGEPSLTVAITGEGDARDFEISGQPEPMTRLARSLAARAFLDQAGWPAARRSHLTGDASARAYETVQLPGRPVRILMNAPRQPDGPPIRDGKPYSRIAYLAESVTPFVAIDRLLRAHGFCAPEIDAADLDDGFLLIEHLGSHGVLDADGQPIVERYQAAAEVLAAMHAESWPASAEAEPGIVHAIPPFDRPALHIETELLIDWYLPFARGRPADEAERAAFGEAWGSVFDLLDTGEKSLVLRDHHSPNLIWRGERTGTGRIGLIDFQDALIGPSAYDVASLAQDARVDLSPDLEANIVQSYVSARQAQGEFDAEAFRRDYAIMAAQRATKILGIFVRLKERDGKPGYIRHLPRLHGYLSRSLAHPALAPIAELYARLGVPVEAE